MIDVIDLADVDRNTLRKFAGSAHSVTMAEIALAVGRLLDGTATADDRDVLSDFAARWQARENHPRTCDALARILEST